MKMKLLILTTAVKLPAINPVVAKEEPAKGAFQIRVLTRTLDRVTQKNLIVSSRVKLDRGGRPTLDQNIACPQGRGTTHPCQARFSR